MQTEKAVWERISEGMEELQKQKLWRVMEHHFTIFAALVSDVSQTKFVQHCINTGDAPPIRGCTTFTCHKAVGCRSLPGGDEGCGNYRVARSDR